MRCDDTRQTRTINNGKSANLWKGLPQGETARVEEDKLRRAAWSGWKRAGHQSMVLSSGIALAMVLTGEA